MSSSSHSFVVVVVVDGLSDSRLFFFVFFVLARPLGTCVVSSRRFVPTRKQLVAVDAPNFDDISHERWDHVREFPISASKIEATLSLDTGIVALCTGAIDMIQIMPDEGLQRTRSTESGKE